MGIFYACDGIYRGSTTIYLVHPEMRNLPLVNWPMILVIAINDVGDATKKRRYLFIKDQQFESRRKVDSTGYDGDITGYRTYEQQWLYPEMCD